MLNVLTTPQDAATWLAARVALQGGARLRCDSRAVQPGDAFIAWPGQATDGRRFVAQALAAGAAACLVEAEGVEAFGFSDARIATVPGLKAATGEIADLCMAQPSAVLDVVATTGTNGKTSTAWWTAQALTRLGRRCGVIGTLGVGEPDKVEATGLTTPDPVTLHQAFRGFVDLGFSACALEASSIGLVEQRLNAARIDVALFTNLTQDHLDYHGTMQAYAAAKRQLFDWPRLRAAVLNVDDAYGEKWSHELRPHLEVWTVGLQAGARLRASGIGYGPEGLRFTVHEGETALPVQTGLIGDYNVHNWLGVLGGLRALGIPLAEAVAACAQVTPVPGRMQRIGHGRELPQVVVDYAHTPDALEKALAALKPLAAARGGKLWVLFGCGGDRDRSKRPLMGVVAAQLADRVLLTSDNPRSEKPAQILADIAAGVSTAHELIEDRAAAIRHAVQQAAREDVIVIAGKGHEDYQEIAGVRHPFDDSVQARAALIERAGL